MDPGPGTHVLVKPGTYNESLNIISNGEQTIPFTTGIELIAPNIIKFPAVITSYSIHYTKLYDASASRRRYRGADLSGSRCLTKK